MSEPLIVTIDDVRAAGLCVHGTRTWFARHGLDFRAFLHDGIDADTVLSIGDAMASRVIEHARHRHGQPEQD